MDREFHRRVRPLSETNPDLFARLDTARQQLGSQVCATTFQFSGLSVARHSSFRI
jgi:hypothetical protein